MELAHVETDEFSFFLCRFHDRDAAPGARVDRQDVRCETTRLLVSLRNKSHFYINERESLLYHHVDHHHHLEENVFLSLIT